MAKAVVVIGSPADGRTGALVDAVLAGVRQELDYSVSRFVLGEEDMDEVVEQLDGAELFVIGTPMYRATYTGLLKTFLDRTPRGLHEEGPAPLRARPVAVVGTGASLHHFLGIDPLLALLIRFFSAYVVPPALYADHACFTTDGSLIPDVHERALFLGRTASALASAIGASEILRGAAPQV
jgi:FMN reductase